MYAGRNQGPRTEVLITPTLHEYRVVWEIELYATNPREAARKALQTQRDPDSTATVFDVYRLDIPEEQLLMAGESVRVDLEEYRQRARARKRK